MGLSFNGTDVERVIFNETEVETVIFNGTEVWNSTRYVVKNGVVVDTSVIDGICVTGTPKITALNWEALDYGTIQSNVFPVVTLASEARSDDNAEQSIRQAIYFSHANDTSAFINGIPKPSGVSKMYVKGTITVKKQSQYCTDINVIDGNYAKVGYGTGRYNVDGYYTITPSSGSFEIEHDLTNYSSIFLIFALGADSGDSEDADQFTMTFKITDLYFK